MAFRVGIATLGCRVNQYESSALIKYLSQHGMQIAPFDEICDAYIINTCTVTAESDRKSRQTVRRARLLCPDAIVAVCGCSSQLAHNVFTQLGADCVCGTRNKLQAARYVVENIGKARTQSVNVPDAFSAPYEKMNGISVERTRAYVKIQDGCNGACTYCAIKNARGASVSRSEDDIIEEIKALADEGFCEVVLTGIETASYGIDTGCTLTRLVEKTAQIEGIKRIRLGSVEPSYLRPQQADALLQCEKLCNHLHLSVQSGSSKILALMKRKYNSEMLQRNMDYILSLNKDFRFSCDIIAGFPGESRQDLLQTAELLQKYPFVHSHIFPYSERTGTPACTMKEMLPKQQRKEHARFLSEISEKAKASMLQRDVDEGKIHTVLFETWKNGVLHGHSTDFTEVSARGAENLKGKICMVKPSSVQNGILIAEII